jgi:hypothetical protein
MILFDIFHKVEHLLGINSFYKNLSVEGDNVVRSDICNDCGKVSNKYTMMSSKEFDFLYFNDSQEKDTKNED